MKFQILNNIKPVEMAGFKVYTLAETASTNTDVLNLAKAGAPDSIVVYAKKQTQGRGRMNRVWESKPEQSLAFTILLRPSKDEQAFLFRFTALAALALADVLEENYGLAAKLKWPNDVLLNGAKVCGILTETLWQGTYAEALAIGMGVNLGKQAYESAKPLRYQAISLEEVTGQLVPPLVLLEAILKRVSQLRPQMGSIEFIQKWNGKLAFKGEKVKTINEKGETESFRLIGIQDDAALLLEDAHGKLRQLYSSEISLSSL